MPTLILTPRYTDDAQLLWNAANQMGWDVVRLTSWKLSKELKSIQEPVLYVEALFAQTLAEEFGIKLVEPSDDFLPKLPEKFVRRKIRLTTLGDARGNGSQFFIKPPNDKSFAAGVYHGCSLPEYFDNNMPVLVSDIVEWKKEFRCFVNKRRVLTASVYMWDQKFQRDNDYKCLDEYIYEAIGFAQTVVNEQEILGPIVLDVGYIVNKGWAVVEANAVWGSGIYGCDPKKVLLVVKDSMQ